MSNILQTIVETTEERAIALADRLSRISKGLNRPELPDAHRNSNDWSSLYTLLFINIHTQEDLNVASR